MIQTNRHNLIPRWPPFALFVLLLWPASAFAQELAVGKVIEKVPCLKDATQSYALYLPTNYTTAKRFPVIYAFDPGARGAVPVERFREAAEKYGYIVIGSNNSRNGPGVPLSAIVGALLDDTQARLAIDDRRIYVTGFSGGARVAGMVAFASKGQIAGVIACGAGFPSEAKPARDLPFAFYGIAGSEDFNLIEVRQLVRTLDSLGATTHLAVFEGEHAWPPATFCTEAVEWMELQAMKAGRRDRNDKLIGELLAKQADRLRADEAAQKMFDAYLKADALAKDFQGLNNISEFAAKAERSKSSKEVKEGFRQEKNEEQLQQYQQRTFYALREGARQNEGRDAAMGELRVFLYGLRRQAEATTPSVERSVARRSLAGFWVSLMEEAAQYRFNKRYGETAATLAVAAEIRPDNPQVFFNLARAQALAGKKREAVEALKKAVEKGFANTEELKNNPDLETIRGEKAYKQLIEMLPKKSISRDNHTTGGRNAGGNQ
jgi:dienelactone hydrolase